MASAAIASIPTPPMSYDVEEVEDHEVEHHKAEQSKRLWDWLRKLRRDEQGLPSNEAQKPDTPPQTPQRPGLGRRLSKKVGVGLPRSTTFKRQQEENRQNLEPVRPSTDKRRENGVTTVRAFSASPKPFPKRPKRETSAPDLGYNTERVPTIDARIHAHDFAGSDIYNREQLPPPPPPPPQPRPAADDDAFSDRSYESSRTLEEEIRLELERKWILNLSMHFRDKSPREKFFITYAQTPQRWRRVTVSCDYRDAEVDSLEADLQSMGSQREKSSRIYESLRGSLQDIQFYDTVTNLKLETRDERLHVHVTEDVNEIIAYPPIRTIQHLNHVRKFKESELHFLEHMSGFVYKVKVAENTWIKKEIPGPDSVDEFLYEVNALSHLTTASHVIEMKGLVTSEDETLVKGLLIAYAEKNALVDVLYDNRGNMPWSRRERWARQIIKGLSEIHEAGYVQGDFTLSNIVVDGNDEARIIDINRRGCPVGWEPPEIAHLIASGQRISMFIGIKSDLFQLGMVLWGLAMEEDEPERQTRPLSLDHGPEEIPGYFRGLVARCLDIDPVMRPSAKDLLREFPASVVMSDPDNESLPELKPAPIFASVPIVKGGTHRAYTVETETSPNNTINPSNAYAKPSSKSSPNGKSDDKGPKYTEMLSGTAKSAERLYSEGFENQDSTLKAPLNHETGSSVQPQTSSNGLNSSVTNLPKATTSTSSPTKSSSSINPSMPLKSPEAKRSNSPSSQRRNSDYHDAPETIQLDSHPNLSTSWSALRGDQASPYEIPLSALDTSNPSSQPSPPLSPENPRRIHHFPRPNTGTGTGIPSPPPHVDSGLADIDTPRASLEHGQRKRSSSVKQAVNGRHQLNPGRRTSDEKRVVFEDGDGGGEAGLARPPHHVDSGIVEDISIAHVGGHEVLSFKARARRSGIIAPELGEEIARMVGGDDGAGTGFGEREGGVGR